MPNISDFAFFVSLNKVFRNFVSGGRKGVCQCFVRLDNFVGVLGIIVSSDLLA